MATDLSPAAVARRHVRDRMAEAASDIAAIYQRALPGVVDEHNRAYLTAAVDEAMLIAQQHRGTGGRR